MKLVVTLLALVCISGCAGSTIGAGTVIVTGQARSPIEWRDVAVFYGEPPAKYEYEVVGIVEARTHESFGPFAADEEAIVLHKLKKQAAKVGADAVIEVKFWNEEGWCMGVEDCPNLHQTVGKATAVVIVDGSSAVD